MPALWLPACHPATLVLVAAPAGLPSLSRAALGASLDAASPAPTGSGQHVAVRAGNAWLRLLLPESRDAAQLACIATPDRHWRLRRCALERLHGLLNATRLAPRAAIDQPSSYQRYRLDLLLRLLDARRANPAASTRDLAATVVFPGRRFGLREVTDITSVHQEIWLNRQRPDFRHRFAQCRHRIGIGGLRKADMGIADLKEREGRDCRCLPLPRGNTRDGLIERERCGDPTIQRIERAGPGPSQTFQGLAPSKQRFISLHAQYPSRAFEGETGDERSLFPRHVKSARGPVKSDRPHLGLRGFSIHGQPDGWFRGKRTIKM
jgi:hypothetical protein